MAGKNRLMARLVAASATITPDSDYIATNLTKTQPQAVGLSVYSSIDSLPTSAATGTKAFVTSNNTLYFYNSGWYKIAIINSFNPQWVTEPDGSYSLAIDGSTTTITVLASDSDDVPITYTAVTDSNFDAFATIAHDSDKHNLWTVTPTGTSGSYSGSVTFKASDGVNLVQAISSFTLSFTVSNSGYTTFLLKADSDGSAGNQTDLSGIHTLTRIGQGLSTAFSPFHPGGYSWYFDGTGDYIRLNANHASVNFDSDFSLEGWFWFENLSSHRLLFDTYASGASGTWQLYWRSTGTSLAWYDTSSASVLLQDSNASRIQSRTWHHIAATRQSGTLRIFVDGTLAASTTGYNTDLTHNQPLTLGYQFATSTNYFQGYMKDVRVIKGNAVYDSDFSVPTEPLTALESTSLLTCHKPYLADGGNAFGTSGHNLIFQGGDVSAKRFSPYEYLEYDKTTHGGSVWLDGTGDAYQATQVGDNITFGTGDFSIDVWYYPTSIPSIDSIILDGRPTNTAVTIPLIYYSSSGAIGFFVENQWNDILVAKPGRWYHIGWSRKDGNSRYFVKGAGASLPTQVGNRTDTNNYPAYSPITIGQHQYGGNYLPGYLHNLRVVKGRSLFHTSAEFDSEGQTISTAVNNTTLLTMTNQGSIYDVGSGLTIGHYGNVLATGTEKKFTNNDSIYFDGSGDKALAIYDKQVNDFGAANFTVECWVYPTSAGAGFGNYIYGDVNAAGQNTSGSLQAVFDSSRIFKSYVILNNVLNTIADTTARSLNTWYHYALVRNGTDISMYIDGTKVGTSLTTSTAVDSTTIRMAVGGAGEYVGLEFQGYIQDFRISKSLARYTSNFTPPTSEFKG